MSNNRQLPENAFRELKNGEEYKPLMSPEGQFREVTPWSLTWGIIMNIKGKEEQKELRLKGGKIYKKNKPK